MNKHEQLDLMVHFNLFLISQEAIFKINSVHDEDLLQYISNKITAANYSALNIYKNMVLEIRECP